MTMFRSDANFAGPHMEKILNLFGGLYYGYYSKNP